MSPEPGLCIRIAKRINHALHRRGRVFVDRYFGRILKTPRQTSACLCYVLNDVRRHAAQHVRSLLAGWLDDCSSARYFDGWREAPARTPPDEDSPVVPPSTWLLRSGWRRHGLLSIDHALEVAEPPRPRQPRDPRLSSRRSEVGMTPARKLLDDDVLLLGAIDWDRRLFDALMPLPQGTSYNCYLVRGAERTVLIDTVDPGKWSELEAQLAEVPRLDHVIIQHVEQDHSGSLPQVLQRYPDATVVTNPRCKGMLIDHLGVPEDRFATVQDGATLALGGRTLRFIYTPWVHWPETMCTYLEEEKFIFSCDFFGSHLAQSEVFADESVVGEPAKRYYAQIMMPFGKFVLRNLEKLPPSPALICPSHGPVWNRPELITSAYREWAGGPPHNLVCLAYVTMHGSTQRMVERLTVELVSRGVAVDRFELTGADLGRLAMSLLDAATLVFATPTVLSSAHPAVAYAALLASELSPRARHAAVIGSYGWGGKTVEKLTATLAPLKLEMLDPVLCKGLPRLADEEALERLAVTIAARHAQLQLAPSKVAANP